MDQLAASCILRHASDVPAEPVTAHGSSGVTIQWLSTKEQMPYFMMRHFVIAPGGNIGEHAHAEDHEIYMTEGEATLWCRKSLSDPRVDQTARAGDFVYVPPNHYHGYENRSGRPVKFICCIPKLPKAN
eukprot:m51a1_g505 hypothetical protein (129) ;mRNA; f:290765-291303